MSNREGEGIMKFASNQIVILLFLEMIALCLLASFRFINIETTITLLIFNILFFSLTFQLHSPLRIKLAMLAVGNIIGLSWNFFLHLFAASGAAFFGEAFNVFYTVFQPIFNFTWIVSFWSVSLSFLTPKSTHETVKA